MKNNRERLEIIPLTLRRENGEWPAVLAIAEQTGLLPDNPEMKLSEEERAFVSSLKHERRMKEFLAGRLAAMEGARIWMGGSYQEDLKISRGLFGNPFFSSGAFTIPEVSISHSGALATALVFPGGHQLAADLEWLRQNRPGRLEAIEKNLNDRETKLASECLWGRTAGLYLYWTQKEALSKAIRCGLTIPFSLVEIEKSEAAGHSIVSWFKNFTQYKAVSVRLRGDYILSIVMPRYTEISGLEKLNQ